MNAVVLSRALICALLYQASVSAENAVPNEAVSKFTVSAELPIHGDDVDYVTVTFDGDTPFIGMPAPNGASFAWKSGADKSLPNVSVYVVKDKTKDGFNAEIGSKSHSEVLDLLPKAVRAKALAGGIANARAAETIEEIEDSFVFHRRRDTLGAEIRDFLILYRGKFAAVVAVVDNYGAVQRNADGVPTRFNAFVSTFRHTTRTVPRVKVASPVARSNKGN